MRLEAIQTVRDYAADHLHMYLEHLAGVPRYDRQIADLREAIAIVDKMLAEMADDAA